MAIKEQRMNAVEESRSGVGRKRGSAILSLVSALLVPSLAPRAAQQGFLDLTFYLWEVSGSKLYDILKK
jgi:hypothetical protein